MHGRPLPLTLASPGCRYYISPPDDWNVGARVQKHVRTLIGQPEGRVLSVATLSSQNQDKIIISWNFLIMRYLVQPPVATYGSCSQTYQVLLSKKTYKE
jgi:hypothetical protein